MSEKSTVLVTAGNGNQARAVIPPLAAAGFHVRAMRRVGRPGPGPLDLGAHEVVVGDACNPDHARNALRGVHAVYHVGPSFHPAEREMGWNMIEQAEHAGVEHFVFSSVLHPILTGLPQHVAKRDVEERLIQSALNFTILQPADYMQMVLLGVQAEAALFFLGWDLDRRQALVDLQDVGEALVRVLEEGEDHYGATYELSSGENLTGHGIAEALSQAFGRPFKARQVEHDYEQPIPQVLGYYDDEHTRHQMATFRTVNEWYGRYDFVGNGNVLRMVLGREPTPLVSFARRHFALGG